MPNLNNRIAEAQERAAQEERRRIRNENRENDRQRKIAIRRQIIIGGIVTKYFPAVINLQPQLKRADTDIKFAGLEEFISTVASDPRYAALFQEWVGEKYAGASRQER